MRRDLLLKGAEILERDAANPNGIQFDLGTWVKPSGQPNEPIFYTFEEKPETIPVNCDTTACAMGLFCLTGEFEKDGLGYEFHPQGGGLILLPVYTSKAGNKSDTFNAAADLFNITHEDATYLFDPDYYPENRTKGAQAELYVADRIREFVDGNIDEEYHRDYQSRDDD